MIGYKDPLAVTDLKQRLEMTRGSDASCPLRAQFPLLRGDRIMEGTNFISGASESKRMM